MTRSDDKLAEYNALRGEILAWIQVEYSLITTSATVTMVALGFFKETDHWLLFSSVLVAVLGCLNALVSFARAKIMLTSAYLIVTHEDSWENRMHDLSNTKGVLLASSLHKIALFSLNACLAVTAICYPLVIACHKSPNHMAWPFYGWILLTLSVVWYTITVKLGWDSYNKQTQIDYWKSVLNKAVQKI